MRIISGKFKGRLLHPPTGLPVRPTTDFAKSALFNILMNRVEFKETSVLELFSGTGSIAFEFISRGCPLLLAIDSNSECIKFIRSTSSKLNITEILTIKADVFSFLKKPTGRYDLIFADPPYTLESINTLPDTIFKSNALVQGGLLIIEHSSQTDFSTHPRFATCRSYGKVNFSFFE